MDYRIVFEEIINEMSIVYKHDKRPWMIGYSGGKDSTLLCCLVMEMLSRLSEEDRTKKVYVVSSDTLVENPIIKDYLHEMSRLIGEKGKKLGVVTDIVYPDIKDTFWCKLIGLGYPTPEAPGFRWCTERLKIKPMNAYTYEKIEENGEIVLLLGVRKDESVYRSNNIKSREIEGKLLIPHKDIKHAYVYNPLTEIPNEEVWQYLLKDDGLSPWGSDNKYLFSLYQGEDAKEVLSVVGEIDEKKIPITGKSRFGCWVCTLVKEDKSLKAFTENGATWLMPLREYRDWLMGLRLKPDTRQLHRRNGSVYFYKDGSLGKGSFTMNTRIEILKRLLELEVEMGIELITFDELKYIDELWDKEGDLYRRTLVELYYNIKNIALPWDSYKAPIYSEEIINTIKRHCKTNDMEFELISKLIIDIEENKHYSTKTRLNKAFNKTVSQGWLHYQNINKGLSDEN